MTTSHKDAGAASFTLSPIINPQYISYSKAKGVSYKIQFGVRYHWNSKRYLTIQPQLGYNFGIKQFYHYTPIRMTYNPKRNGYAEIVFANGNRISNSSVIEVIRNIYGNDSAKHYQKMEMDYFNDNYIQAINNVQAYDWLEIKAGIVYHIRKPKNPSVMEKLNMPTIYRSFAPTLTLHISPWRRGPYFTLNYERSIKGIMGANLEYERYEFDVSHKFKLLGLRRINLKGGFGVYTNSKTSFSSIMPISVTRICLADGKMNGQVISNYSIQCGITPLSIICASILPTSLPYSSSRSFPLWVSLSRKSAST